MKYEMTDPIVVIFNAGENLEEMAKAANNEISETQLPNKAVHII